uniref:uncharacterized protein LOC124054657 isoform X2 n=1 Tax=Scatophagus argus TaxID=75038 RepID=UPI001ED7CD20|nr:uncharacterized protein LOC124054657 isoform X2 [Scatophagus argus]
MDPELFSPPEIINDREAPDCTQSGFSHFSLHYHPSFPADRSAPQQELDFYSSLSEPLLQTRHKIFIQSGQFCPSEPHFVMDESTLPRASAVPEKLQTRANPDQRPDRQSCIHSESTQQSVHYLIPNWTGPIEPQIQTQDSLCPLRLQALSPGVRSQSGFTPLLPEFTCSSCSPPDSCWINMSPVTSAPNSRFGCSPCVLVSADSPAEFWHSPCVPPCSVVVMPEIQPCCCVGPQRLQVHQPCSPYQVLRREAQQVSKQFSVTPESAASEEEQQKIRTPDKDKLQANNTDDETTKPQVSPGSRPSLLEDLVAGKNLEKWKMIIDLILKVQKDVKANENGNEEDEDEKKEDSLFLEYLEELCSDEDFVRNVELMLNVEYLNSLFSADPELIDLFAWIEQDQEAMLQECPPSTDANVDAQAGETSPLCCQVGSTLNTEYQDSLLSSDPNPNDLLPLRELHRKPSANSSSITPITEDTLTSHAGEAASLPGARPSTADPPGTQSDVNQNHEGQDPPLSTRNIASKKDNSLTSVLEAEEPEAVFPTEGVSENSSMSLSDLAGTHSAQTPQKLQEGPLDGDPPASEATSTASVSGSAEELDVIAVMDPVPGFRVDLWTGSPPQSAVPGALNVLASLPAQKRKSEEHSRKSINPKPSCLEDYTVPVPANSSFEAASHAESCVPSADTDSSDRLQASREQNKENQNRKQQTVQQVQIRCSQRLSGKADKNNTRPSGEFITEKAEERKPSAKSVEKTEKFTRETDGATHEKQTGRSSIGRQLFKGEGSLFKESSQASKAASTDEQFSGNEKMEQHQTLAGEMQKQHEANNSDVSSETGAENSLLPTMTREEKESSVGREKRETEGTQMSTCMRRPTRSLTAPPKSSLQSLRVQTDTHSPEDSAKEDQSRRESAGGLLNEISESPSAKSCEKNPNLTSEPRQQRKTVALCAGGAAGAATWDFYSLRSNESKGTASTKEAREAAEATSQPSKPSTDPEQTAGVKGEDKGREQEEDEHPSLTPSPIKRHRHELPEEKETTPSERGAIGLSPMKRGRWRDRQEANSEGDEGQKWTGDEKDEAQDTVDTPGCQPRPSSTRGNRRAKDGLSAARETFRGVKGRATETRASRTGAQPAKKPPTKCGSLILCKTNRHK